MKTKVYIINPTGEPSSIRKKASTNNKRSALVRKRKSKRSHASYVKAGKKAARSRKRRKNPTKHRVTVYATGRGKKKRLRRSSKWRLGVRKRINPSRKRRSRRRRNPAMNLRSMGRTYFGKARITNALMILVGLGGAGFLKGILVGFMPAGIAKEWGQRLYGVAAIILGVTLQQTSRRKEMKSAGMGMVVFGFYDLIVSNTPLGQFLPTISAPTFSGNYLNYGQGTYADEMGASLAAGGVEVVGANIEAGVMPEIIGMEDMGLEDALEMSV